MEGPRSEKFRDTVNEWAVCILLECILILINYYRPQRSWGKVIFSQPSVILFTGGVLPPEGASSGGGHFLPWGVLPPGGYFLPGGCLLGGGAGEDPPGTATAAGCTHPTGMHSCYYYKDKAFGF